MEKLNELAELARLCASMKHSVDANAAYANFICRVEPKDITAIEEAFRALERTSDTNMAAAQAMRDDMYHWKQRAEAAEAKLAGFENQKTVGTVSIAMDWSTHRNVATVNMRPDLVVSEMKDGDELFTRPARAADLVPEGWKLVPVEPTTKQWAAGVKAMDAGIDKPTLCYSAMLAAAPEVSSELV